MKKRTRNIIIAVIAGLAAAIAIIFFIAAHTNKPVVTDTGKFIITEKGINTNHVTIEIAGKIPDKYEVRIDTHKEECDIYDIELVSDEDDTLLYELTGKTFGTSILDFYIESKYSKDLYQKLHYTLDVLDDLEIKLYTLNVTE